MPSSCVPHTSLPGASRLFTDSAYHFDRVRRFYDFAPGEPASYALASAAVQYPEERRAALVEALRELNPGHPSLDLLARPGTRVVATGQQVGLLFGPAYTIYKALTAAKLAQQLTANGIPAVPVFWLATEDHDLQEIDHCWVFDSAHRAVRIDAGGGLGTQGPVGRIPVGGNPVEALRGALEGLPFAEEVTAAAQQAYTPGRTFGETFRALFRKLLSSYGLLCLDPLQPAMRQAAAPLLERALGDSGELVRLVLGRNRELGAAGYHAQVHVDDDSSLLFLLDGEHRLALRSQGDGFVAGGRTFSLAELRDRAADLSPNALLRPVVQDYLMPTVACVMGPAELAYMAQAQVIYRALLGRMPVIVNRASFTLADARCHKLMRRYGLSLPDCLVGAEALRSRIGRELIPAALGQSLQETAIQTGQRLEALRAELMSFDPTLAEAMDRSRRKILHQIGKIDLKTRRESLRRDERASRETSYLLESLHPHGVMQERVYSILPFLAQHGAGLLDTLYENVRPECPDHQLLVV